ncbi:MAG: Gfo/Idh/MocA family oxidoreductase [Gemmatimonadota bacterium]|nr:Gfo/Idh/MocA family oxidoreductase [Gemmatimonadota bacterium]
MGRSEPPRVACIGAGAWGRNIVRNLSELGALGWICETSPEAVELLAGRYPDVPVTDSVEEILANPDVDAVAIATPAATHGDLVRRALTAGLDVFVEKPLCLSIDEGRELVELAEREERILMVGHLLWYHPAVVRLKELVDEGALGRIQYIYSNRLNLGRIRREENILWSFAPHDVSVILGLLGETPSGIEARGGAYLSADVADVTVSILQFASGVKAHIFVSWLHPFKEQKLVVVGDRKMAVFDDTDPEHKLRLYPYSIEWKERFPTPRREEAEPVEVASAEPLRAEFEHFLERLRDRETPRTDGREALRVLSVLAACQAGLEAAAPPGLAGEGEAESGPESASPRAPADGDAFVHPTAVVDDAVEIGRGTKVWHFSHILRNTRIGEGCSLGQNVMAGPNVTIGDRVKIQNNVSVYDGVTLEDDVFVGPSAVFTNVYNPRSAVPRMDELRRTLVREGASLGANCTIVCGITIGRSAFVGAGAVVLRDVPDHGLVVGNPGRLAGWMCSCGERIEFPEDGADGACRACGASYRKRGTTVEPAGAPRPSGAVT